jgi:hypothetical protein
MVQETVGSTNEAMTEDLHYVIGGGPAGQSAAQFAAFGRQRILLIDPVHLKLPDLIDVNHVECRLTPNRNLMSITVRIITVVLHELVLISNFFL